MERYEKYKDSGVEWIGEIPEEWGVKKLKRLIKNLESGVSVNSTDFPASNVSYGILKTSCVYNYFFDPKENKEIWQSELIRAKINPRKGELIISRMNTPDLVGASGYVENDHANLFLPDRLWQTKFYEHVALDTKWLSFVTKSLPFRKHLSILATGTSPSMKNLAQEDFLNIDIPFPKQREQTAIANYLDRKTAEIDALIAQKERLIALYEEEKTAIINQAAATKGIDSDVGVPLVGTQNNGTEQGNHKGLPLRDSGIDWLGEIPEEWEVKKLKYLVSKVGSGITPKGGASVYQLNGIPLLRSQNIHFDGLKMDDVAYISEEIHDAMANSKVQAGDVLLNITGASIGRCFYADEDLGEANVNQHVCIVRPKNEVATRYLYFVLRSNLGQDQIDAEQTGSGREGLNFEALNNFLVPYC